MDPSLHAEQEHFAFLRVTAPLRQLIIDQDGVYCFEALALQIQVKSDISQERREILTQKVATLYEELLPALLKVTNLATHLGASSWLTIKEHHFSLHKGAIWYSWSFSRTASTCVCGASFAVDHLLSCQHGRVLSLRHRDVTATLLMEVCNDVRVEPDLQEITCEVLPLQSASQHH